MYSFAIVVNVLAFILNVIAYYLTKSTANIVWIIISMFCLGMLYSINGQEYKKRNKECTKEKFIHWL